MHTFYCCIGTRKARNETDVFFSFSWTDSACSEVRPSESKCAGQRRRLRGLIADDAAPSWLNEHAERLKGRLFQLACLARSPP